MRPKHSYLPEVFQCRTWRSLHREFAYSDQDNQSGITAVASTSTRYSGRAKAVTTIPVETG